MEPREIVAWVLAAVAVTAAGASIATRSRAPAPGVLETATANERLDSENKRLRSSVGQLRAEQMALRGELDRLLETMRIRAASATPPAGPPSGETAAASPDEAASERARARKVASELDALSRGITDGTSTEGMKVLFDRIRELQSMGEEALPAMKEAFDAATDPGARNVLGSLIATRGGPEEQQFLLRAAEKETEPAIKQSLLSNASMMGGEGRAAAQTELAGLIAAGEPTARIQALSGLVDLENPIVASTVRTTLASDPNEQVRLAAFGALVRNAETRDEAFKAAFADPSPRVREIAECRQRLDEVGAF